MLGFSVEFEPSTHTRRRLAEPPIFEGTTAPGAIIFENAYCRYFPIEWFFPDSRGNSPQTHMARALCDRCAVEEACLSYALTIPSLRGIWGGTSEKDRIRIRALRKEYGEPL